MKLYTVIYIKFDEFNNPKSVGLNEYHLMPKEDKGEFKIIQFKELIKQLRTREIALTNFDYNITKDGHETLESCSKDLSEIKFISTNMTFDSWKKQYELIRVYYSTEKTRLDDICNYVEFIELKHKKTGKIIRLSNKELLAIREVDSALDDFILYHNIVYNKFTNCYLYHDDNNITKDVNINKDVNITKTNKDNKRIIHSEQIKAVRDKLKMLGITDDMVKVDLDLPITAFPIITYKQDKSEAIITPKVRDISVDVELPYGKKINYLKINKYTYNLELHTYYGNMINRLDLGDLTFSIMNKAVIERIKTTGVLTMQGDLNFEKFKNLITLEMNIMTLLLGSSNSRMNIIGLVSALENYYRYSVNLKFNWRITDGN